VFRRTKPAETETASPPKPGGKGRPTPSRKEAEAAARARAKGARNRKEAARLARQRRAQETEKMRQALRTGDERHLPARDRGPVRSFVRDRVDARLSMAELLLPALIAIMVLTYSSNPALNRFGQSLWMVTILLVTVDTLLLVFRLKRDLKKRFPDESHRGAVFYGVLRATQLRFLRLPKSKVKIGQKLPERY
jgi:hypothetical protein